MKSKHCFQRFTAALACLMLCVLCMPHAALAKGYDVLPEVQDCSVSLTYHLNDSGVADVEYSVYKVADMDRNVQLTLTEEFQDCAVLEGADLKDLCGSLETSWVKLAESLTNYCAGMDPVVSKTTDENGEVSFEGLSMGLYLVVGNGHLDPENSDIYYRPAPFLVALPSWVENDAGAVVWTYDVAVTSKPMQSLTPGRVLKVWSDGNTGHDPIQVQLLKDGEPYGDPVTLSEENNWRSGLVVDLDDIADWALQELNEPAYYRVSVFQEGITFVVTNTYVPPYAPPAPGDPQTPPEEVEDPDVPQTNLPGLEEVEEVEEPDQSDPESDEIDDPDVPMANLPQTGQLWWPVPVLAAAGVLMFLFGLKRRSGANYEK